MSEVKWIKIVTNIFDDEKIRYIETLPSGDEIIVIWFKILCLAGRSNSNGLLMMTDKLAYTDQMLSSIFVRDIKSIQLALGVFESLEMIEMMDNKIYLKNWEKHQNAEKLALIKEQTRIRVAKHRENRQISNANSVTQSLQDGYCNAIDNISISNSNIINSNSSSLKNNTKKKREVFSKPSIDEIRNYILDDNLNVDADTFFDYYESNGWVVGKNKMKDWKATLRNWSRKNIQVVNAKKSIKFNIMDL